MKLSPNFSIQADHINVKSRTELSIDFTIPNTLTGKSNLAEGNLILYNPIDGSSVYPAALFIRKDSLISYVHPTYWEENQMFYVTKKEGIGFPFGIF